MIFSLVKWSHKICCVNGSLIRKNFAKSGMFLLCVDFKKKNNILYLITKIVRFLQALFALTIYQSSNQMSGKHNN